MFDIWNQPKEIAEEIYARKNYLIIDNPNAEKDSSDPKICVIYCSSNNIWSPNEEYAFKRSFVENDYFEWKKLRVKNASREIWIRDIFKSWYVTGINSEIDSIDKLIDFLKEVTTGYSVEIVGSSAGGYIAAVLSKALKADKTIVFSAQFDLNHPGAISVNPFLQRYKGTDREKYYDLSEYLADSESELFYIYPMENSQDTYHFGKIEGINSKTIHCLGLKSKRHGMVVYKCCVEPLINLNIIELKKLFIKENHASPLFMSLRFVGGGVTFRNIWQEVCRLTKKMIKKVN